SPSPARVICMKYSPGLFLNAMRPDSALRNENLWIGLEEEASPHRRMIVRQIAGLFARRIVCNLRPGEIIERGHKFGMIKLGSRTELILPREEGLCVAVQVGEKVKAGSSIMARYPVNSVVGRISSPSAEDRREACPTVSYPEILPEFGR
ncbi:MAG TPA: phosphatidylserine decarboxylase, partial [Pirellulales bacterium]|nr:phosphatidylserine decarboxylase [Pirellulales bacterium]